MEEVILLGGVILASLNWFWKSVHVNDGANRRTVCYEQPWLGEMAIFVLGSSRERFLNLHWKDRSVYISAFARVCGQGGSRAAEGSGKGPRPGGSSDYYDSNCIY